jgi:hypothetical protein
MIRLSRSYSRTASQIAVIGALIFLSACNLTAAFEIPPPGLIELLKPDQGVVRTVWKEDILFVFEGQAGEVITISVKSKSPGLDPHVSLLDPEKKEEASDDDSGRRSDSLIKNHKLKKSGRYTVSVGVVQGSEGVVEVLLKKAAAPIRKLVPGGRSSLYSSEISPSPERPYAGGRLERVEVLLEENI